MDERAEALRELPSVDSLLRTAEAAELLEEYSAEFVAAEARALVETWRAQARAGELDAEALRALRARGGAELRRAAREAAAPSLARVVNATGVVVHTNLGRAPWPRRVIERAAEIAGHYSNLEYDLAGGERGAREAHVRGAQLLFGAEAALVVNNNAAAVLLLLSSLAEGRETVVSRGELVEIGGSFRIPEILARSGSILREVGTTNRTRLDDYASAIGERTALLLKVHPSNYRIRGFTEAVGIAELAGLGRSRGIPVAEDLGSGDVLDLRPAGVGDEPTVAASLAAGADLVTISGDKLLGGPQAGIVLGRRHLVARLKANPLYRALRPDKVTIAALEELFAIYRSGDPWREVPVLRALRQEHGALEARAKRLASRIATLPGLEAAVVAGASAVGGGAAPLASIPSPLIAVAIPKRSAAALEEGLRRHRPPVIARVEDGRVLLDLRTVAEDEEEEEAIFQALRAAVMD